ncbi:MAG TPA: sensor domain-containing diguanylate cyclase [Gallionella sp.]|nr:sensor domain-containing diguanylate cyclase [Gallionella sp.]
MKSASFNKESVCEKIWDAVNLGLILIDGESRILMWNEWVARHSGIPDEVALTHTLESLFPDGLSTYFKTAIKNALSYKLPIVLSNALHRSPLPLYPVPVTRDEQPRMQQSITITPIPADGENHLFLIQITDTSMSIKRERVLKSHSERLNREATTDALTGAYNRRFFDDRYNSELGRAQRQNTALSLLLIDVDFFKAYNDSYGHIAGDRVLVAVVRALKSQLNRPTDVVVRYGGEEFAVILPDSGPEGSEAVAEKLRAAVSSLNIAHSGSQLCGHITISIGIATCQPGSTSNVTALLETADSALYRAKHDGRNCVRHLFS